MKAVQRDRYGPPDVLYLAEVERPRPSGDQVVVEVEAGSLNTADVEQLVAYPWLARVGTGFRGPNKPGVGLDVAGRVVEVGPEATDLRPGDEVWADLFQHGHSAFAEYVCAPERAFSPKPSGATFEEAATLPHSGVLALQALSARGPIRSGEEILINGAGGCVGPFAVQIAKAMGAVVTGVDHTGKLDLVREAGADRVVDYTREDVTRRGQIYDRVVDIASGRNPLHFRRSLAPGGRYVFIARNLGGLAQAAVLGGMVSLLSDKRMGVFGWEPNRRRDLDALRRLVDEGKVRPLIDRRYRLEEVAAAYQRLAAGKARGKLVILPQRGKET